MASGSRLKAIDQKLKTVIAARAGLSAIPVDRGHPGELLQREHIWIDRVRMPDAQYRALSPTPTPKRQVIEAEIIVRVRLDGDDAATMRDRCFDLADEVDEALRANPGLTDAAEFGGITSAEYDDWQDSDGRVGALLMTATYNARKG